MSARGALVVAMVTLVACAPAGPPPLPTAGAPAAAPTPELQARRDATYRESLALVKADLLSAPLAGPAEPPSLLARRRLARGADGFRAALAIDPAFWPAWWALGKTYERLDRPKEAVACLETAFTRAPETARAPIARDVAASTARLGDPAATIRAYETAVRLDQYDTGLVAHLAAAHLEAGNVDRARRVLLDGLRRHGNDVTLRRMLGRADVVEQGASPCVAAPGAPCPPGTAPSLPGSSPVIRRR